VITWKTAVRYLVLGTVGLNKSFSKYILVPFQSLSSVRWKEKAVLS
jgi:hypothetical protein